MNRRFLVKVSITRITDYETEIWATDASHAEDLAIQLEPDELDEVDSTTLEWTTKIEPLPEEEDAA